MYLIKYSDLKALSLFKNAKICDNKNCVTFAEDFLNYGYLEKDDTPIKLMLCDYVRAVENFMFCDAIHEYKCYNEKVTYEGDCEIMKSNYVPNQSYHFAGNQIYFYVDGKQKVHEFYLTQEEREELVAKFHPEQEDDLLIFLKSKSGRYYFFGWHVAMVIIGILSLIINCVMRCRKWVKTEKERQSKEKEKQDQESNRTLKDNSRIEELELRLNLLQHDMDGIPKRTNKAKRVEFYNR